mgnify:CR=1 FL=1
MQRNTSPNKLPAARHIISLIRDSFMGISFLDFPGKYLEIKTNPRNTGMLGNETIRIAKLTRTILLSEYELIS